MDLAQPCPSYSSGSVIQIFLPAGRHPDDRRRRDGNAAFAVAPSCPVDTVQNHGRQGLRPFRKSARPVQAKRKLYARRRETGKE